MNLLKRVGWLAAVGAAVTLLPAVAQEKEAEGKAGDAKAAQAADAKDARGADLTLRDLFPPKGHFGKTARGAAWSFDDRYLAYLWNAYGDKGWDLWLYDTKDGKATQLTSLEKFTNYDRESGPILERYKKDKEEDERRKKLSDEERRKLEDEDEKKNKARKEPQKEYAGVSQFVWAEKSNELIYVQKGDLYRLVIGQEKPTRLTRTDDSESAPRYSLDDKAFYFRRGRNVYRARFDSPVVDQVNPELPNGAQMSSFWLSPDETTVLISAHKTTGQPRQVTYVTYKDRFAQAQTAARDVADDTFKSESFMYVCTVDDDPKKGDGKPWEVYRWPAGDELGQVSVHEKPWSADSKKVVFCTWQRDKRILEVVVADLGARKTTVLYRDTHSGEHTTPGMVDPFFTPDARHIVMLLEKSGYRHLWLLDPLVGGATQVTRGDFEVYPVKMAAGDKHVLVRSSKQHPARSDYYRVSLPDGEMVRLTDGDGRWESAAVSHDGKRIAATFGSWSSQPELRILNGSGKDAGKALTASHPGTLDKAYRLKAELFSYQNRHGQTVYGYRFLPPGLKKGDKRPLLLYVYGGPLGTGKTVEDGSFGGDGYGFPMYMALKHGYVCASIDPRGSSGYSAAFGGANWEGPGKAQVEDLVDGVKHFAEEYGIDTQRVGVHGWSFGGFQTQMCMYTAPETFTLGIAGAGPTEWQNYNNWYSGGVIGKAAPGKPETLDQYSLTHQAKNLKGHLMLLHGIEDTNVLFQDTIKVYRELLKAGKGPLVELVVDPTGGHGLGGDISYRDRFAIYEGYLLRHWGSAAK